MPRTQVSLAAGLALALWAPLAWGWAYNPSSLAQRNSDGTALCAGCTVTQGTEVELTARSDLNSCNGETYNLEFEIRPTAQAFTNVPTHGSPALTKPSCIYQTYTYTRISGLATGTAYKWQVREKDATTGQVSGWVYYNGGATAFTTGATVPNRMAITSAAQTRGATR
jgi:hypothetical protein